VAWPGCVRSGPDDRGAGRLSRESADALCETKVSAHLAIAYRLLRRYDEAIAYAEASLSGTRAQAGQHLGRSLSNLGLLYVEAGRFEEGASLLEQSLAASRQAGDRAYESQAHCGLADACRGLGRHHDAIRWAESGLRVSRRTGDPWRWRPCARSARPSPKPMPKTPNGPARA
jgi:tetratricopeptide (TPR) repeat protein